MQPYDLKEEIYRSYPIQIRLDTDENKVTKIEIEDRGTGITIDTFKRMCNVGVSPSGSDALKKKSKVCQNGCSPLLALASDYNQFSGDRPF